MALHAAVIAIAYVAILAGCGSSVDSGGLTANDRNAAEAALNALQPTNIPRQLINLTATAGLSPTACRVHLESSNPSTFKVYVFWTPYVGLQTYTWLTMTLTKDTARDTFHLGTAETVLPGGVLEPGGKGIVPGTADYDTPLAQYESKHSQEVLAAHAGNVFSKPGAKCQVLQNGYLRLVPNP